MSDGIMITIGDDGEATLYDDTYDITIHCESKEEQDEVRKALENIPHWIPVTEEPIPDGEYLVTWTSEIQEKPILSIICRYSGVWDCLELQMLGHQDINVLAYMELPEPYKGGDGMNRLITLVIPFCLGAIITRSIRSKDYFVLTFAVIAYVANIAFVYLMGR